MTPRRSGAGTCSRAPLPSSKASFEVSPTLALVLGAGSEIAFGRTDVFVHQAKVAEIAPFRVVMTGGLVARF